MWTFNGSRWLGIASNLGIAAGVSFMLSTQACADERPKIDSRIFECEYLVREHPGFGVIMVLGDSNITRDEITPVNGLPTVFNVNPINGLCYPAHEPLMGTIANNGSPWVRLGNALVSNEVYKDVLLVPIMLDGSTTAEWKNGGRIEPRMQKMLATLAKQHITVDAVIWQHGQNNDAKIHGSEEYKADVNAVITTLRSAGVTAPVYIAKTGDCPGKASGPVWDAQSSLPDANAGIKAGADISKISSDLVNSAQCTLTDKGIDAYVQQWLEIIRPQ